MSRNWPADSIQLIEAQSFSNAAAIAAAVIADGQSLTGLRARRLG